MDAHQNLLLEEAFVIIILLFQFTFIMVFLLFSSVLYPLLSQSLIYLNSVQLMSIMDHYGYTTRPLVEFNLDIYTERASFLGWLSHMSERKTLAITLDPAASEPARFKNKRIQASGDIIKPDTPINVYTRFCLNTAKSKFSLVSPVADW